MKDLICFSHLRWDFVFQRPQHLMTRFAQASRVFYFEEPVYTDNAGDTWVSRKVEGCEVYIIVPQLSGTLQGLAPDDRMKSLLDEMISSFTITDFVLWYYSPVALSFSGQLSPTAIVYDCMDELSAFKGAPPELISWEQKLFEKADLVFTGGHRLFEAKKSKHHNIFSFPSSIDKAVFAPARNKQEDPADQAEIPHPRLGFFGVIDERFDSSLVKALAEAKPDFHFVFIGPVVKIDPTDLPRQSNIHYLGIKEYPQLPKYIAGWDICIMPFAINPSTEFISPTKTPEFLAAGKRVISTPIHDVLHPYGERGLVGIASTGDEFIEIAMEYLDRKDDSTWLLAADHFLEGLSWDKTFSDMKQKLNMVMQAKSIVHKLNQGRMYDYLIVGAGLSGSVLAERLAGAGKKILIVDKRNHIGGNTYDFYNEDGLLVHKYGPHIFHTNSLDVFQYLGRFTEWRPYEHRVLASVDGMKVPIPINQDTINNLYGLNLSGHQITEFLQAKAEKKERIVTSEDVVVNGVGRELYEKFFRGYTRKQWGMDPSELDASVAARIPVRSNRDNRYFTDSYQAMPMHGYTKMFEKILAHPNIHLVLNADFKDIMGNISFRKMIYTGPIDYYFDYCYGKLPYRSIEFKFKTFDQEVFQPTGTVNFPNDQLFTRITEFKYITGQQHAKTSVVYEYPQSEGDPYYPVPRPENAELYRKYQLLAQTLPDVFFSGRLATYKYYNMDQVVAQSLTLFKKIQAGSTETHNEQKFQLMQ